MIWVLLPAAACYWLLFLRRWPLLDLILVY
jgi:hypothetical protein